MFVLISVYGSSTLYWAHLKYLGCLSRTVSFGVLLFYKGVVVFMFVGGFFGCFIFVWVGRLLLGFWLAFVLLSLVVREKRVLV